VRLSCIILMLKELNTKVLVFLITWKEKKLMSFAFVVNVTFPKNVTNLKILFQHTSRKLGSLTD